ncbi:hypothetical protein SZMC14600_01372 [Saccharomonospora azurea SZMC 14600]|uniref:hypothetical protein n=1 Tax=Saccharomonospora azurea TaxID=40988 RepID=UPI0002400BA2|nr:hypothetical protein [Saccharomonospora azurea]EHK89232.1 hypothetical protein SZMC14600_01372 [Saccharomonospora azurea SZMC 14600]
MHTREIRGVAWPAILLVVAALLASMADRDWVSDVVVLAMTAAALALIADLLGLVRPFRQGR